ncbi:hypothetical protein [Burkholderia mayonis]|uniref:hypothetical protein n=1 Tax=Burkholderia mayonis TaxID=1385591 RepID=UPI0009EC1352|nr:hypothetical protein [Burkholderia mayonis]
MLKFIVLSMLMGGYAGLHITVASPRSMGGRRFGVHIMEESLALWNRESFFLLFGFKVRCVIRFAIRNDRAH